MTTTTELLILESQNQNRVAFNKKLLDLTDIIDRSSRLLYERLLSYELSYDLNNRDVVRLLKHILIRELCEEKKAFMTYDIGYVFRDKGYTDQELKIFNNVFNALCITRNKPAGFITKFKKYLKQEELNELAYTYFMININKLAILR